MPERIGVIPTWAWIVGAILVIGVVLTGYRMIQTQQRLQTVQTDLERAKQGADQARAMTADLEKRTASLNSELENATTQRGDLQTKLDEATLQLKSVQSTLESAQSRVGATQSELESVKQAADQARAQAEELKKRVDSLTLELEKGNAQRNALQSEIARLNSELEQARAVSP